MEDNKNKTKVDLMYDDLFEQGYLEKDRDTFNKFFYAPGEQGYKNRKALYDDLHEQGYLESPTYEDFAKGIGLHTVDGAQQPSSTNASAAASGVVGGVSGSLTPGSYAQAYAQGTQGNGRPDMVESLNKYYEGMQAQNTPQAPANTKQPEAPAPSTGGSSNAPKSSAPKMVRQENLYVDDKGNPVLGYTKEDAQEIERSELYYPLMKNDSINVRNTQAFRKGWLTAPQYEKNRKYNEAQAAGYKAQGEKFKNLTDQQLVQAMREEEKKLDGSTSPEALQASMNVTYIETLMAAREWGLGDVAGLNANPHMVDYHMARDYYNKNGLVDKYEKNMLTGRDDNPLLIRGWELIEEQYAKDEAEGNHHKSSYYRNLPFHDPKFAEEFGAYITARIKATGERWNDAVKDAIDDFEAAAQEGRVGQRHSEEYLGSANREQVDDMLDRVNSALKKRTDELDDKFMNKSWFQRMGESSLDPENPSSRYLNDPDASNLIWAGRALQDAKKIIAAFDANRLEDGLTGFFKGAGRGLVDSLGDLSTWDGGISDLLSAQRLDAAVEKFKKGKPLSASEKALLEATSLKLATAEIFKEVGRGYKAGTVTGESLPFMVEMALNPIAKSGDKIASGLAKYANKYLGKYLKKMVSKLGRSSAGRMATRILGSGFAKKAGKVAARVAGDIGAAGGMAATSGLGHSAANAIGYHTGGVQYQQGAGGKTHFSGVMGGDDWVTSTLKGFGSTTIENASEMWGEYFKPVTNFLGSVSGKALEKMHLGAITRWLNDVNSTEMARLMSDFRKQTRWDGSIAEYFEEVAGNIANALTVGDMNFSLHDKDGKFSLKEENSVFNVDDNVDTFLGVSLMSGAMGAANIVGYRTPKYRAKQDVKRYGDMAKRIFGGHGNDWSTIANLIQDNSEEARKQLVVDLMQSGKYSKREKQIALQYAGAVYKSMGMDLGESKQKRSAGDQEASDAYGRGYNMANLENISETSGVYNQLRAQMEQEYGTELMERMDKEPGLVYGWVRAGAVSEEDAQKVLNYLNAKMAYDGAMDRLNDDDAAAKAAAEAHVDDTIHTEENGGDGQIHPVALKGREGDFFVVSGNVVADNDGNVDVEASDNDIVVVDSDGNRIMTNAKNIGQVGETIDPEAAKADAVAKIDGATQEVINGEESGESGISEEESVESPEAAEDTDLEDETQVESTTPEATTTGTDVAQAPLAVEKYNQDDLVTVEVDGQQVTGIITNGLDNDGNVTIYFDEPINGRQNWQMTPEQLNQVAVSYTSRDGVKIDRSVGETPQPQQQQTPGAPVQEQAPVSGESEEPLQQPAANGELDVQTGETPQTPNAPVAEAPQQAPTQPSLPVGEDGNADFSNATPQEAHDYIYNDPELDEDEANQTVQNYADAAAEELAKAQAVLDVLKSMPAPQMKDYGRDTAGYKRAKRERNEAIAQAQAAVDAAQRDVDLWKGVQAQHMMNRAAANAAANREENPAAPSAPASGENENNAPTPSQATPAQGQQTTESTQEPSAPQPNEENGPVASTTPSSSEEERGESEEAAEQPTTTADERIENARIARLIQRAEQLAATCGIPVRICKSEDEIPARYKKAFETAKGEGKNKSFVNGFFYHKKTANGELNEIVLYIPDIAANGGMWRLERTFLHEAVAHGGLRALFENAQDGIQTFNDLCDKVWNEVMPSGEKRDKRDYVLRNKYGDKYDEIKKQYRKEGKSLDDLMTDELKREAADEYMAHLAEEGTDKTLLEKVVQAVRDALRKIKLIDKKFNDMDIVDLLAASHRNLTEMDRQVLNQDVADELDRLALAGEDNGGSTLMSTTSIMEGGGLEVSREVVDKDGKVTKEPLVDDEGNLVARYNGKEYSAKNPITADDLREGDVEGNEATVLQMLINDARDAKNISNEQAAKIYQNYADMINLFLKCGSAENGGADTVMENWEWLGDTVFRAVAANGDAQYSYSMDITKVCKKNEAVIKSISALQLREGRGATPSEIVEIYRDTHVEGYQVPCPVCYVFTRYIRNGKYASAAITGMEEYGEHLPGGKNPWTLKQWRDELNRLDRTMNPDSKQKRTDAEKEQAKRFKKQLDEANDITVYYEDRVNALSFLLTSKFTSEARKKEILEELRIIDAQYKAAVNIIARQSLTNWIKTFAIQEKDGKWSMREDAKKPEDMDDFRINALDLRLTSNTILNYPAIQRLRKSGGSAAGKEISFESDNRLGEVVSGLGINKSNLNTYSNVYEEVLKAPNEKERKKLRKKATERFHAASEYAQQQTLRGGQRMWSWSDNIERLSPDIAINIMQLQLLGGAMQTYSKQLEGIKLAAQMGAYVNGSLMAKDNGWEEVKDSECYERDGELWLKKDKYDVVNEPRVGKRPRKRKRIIAAKDAHVYQAEDGKKYVLVYDDIVGVDPFGNEHDGKRKKGLFQLNKELDRAGNILVGMNDLHVRAAMADPAVYFIIPWHASGANNHILNEMLEVLGQRMTERLDYTVMQEEKNMLDRNKDTKKLPEVTQRLRDLWEEGRQWAKQNKWKSGMEVDSNGDLITESQYMYRALRGLIFDGSIFEAMPTEEQYQEAVEIVTNMQTTVDELNARNEAWKAKSPEYKKSPEGKAEKKEIDDARTKANKNYKPAVHTIELHDGLIDWRDSSVNAEDAEWQAQHPKRINVEEARRIIEADEFLKQVYDRVSKTPGQKMTSGDNTYIYPYEYWQETDAKGKPADIKDADINGKRYVEYCRRMGYKPKFSGNWKTGDVEKQNQGNFVGDKGYWKLLIDRRMYDRNGKYQWLDPVDSDNFETSLVDPRETHKEFHVTKVADDKAADEIAQKVFERLSTRTESGFAAADYNKPLGKIMDEYDAALAAGVQNGKIKLTAAEESMVERMKAATVEEAEEAEDSGVMFSSTPAEVSEEEREVLMGIHNITAAKLRSAIGLGGLANPSMAVVDTTKGLLNNFGEISLIPGRDLIDKKTGKNAGTFTADAYTPRFPTVHRRLGKGGEKKLSQWIKSLGMRPEMEYNTTEQFNDWVNGFDIQDNALVYPFLHEKGLSTAVDHEDHNKVSAPFREIVGRHHGDINALMDAFDTNEEVRQEITDIIIDDIVKQEAQREEGESWKDFRDRRRKWRQLVNDAYLDFAGFVDRGIARATLEKECGRYSEGSRFNPEASRQAASLYIDKNGMRSEYTQWREQRFAELGVEQQMYAGSDREGRSKYKPITLESVSKAMKKQGLAGGESSFFSQGPGGVRARLTPRLNSLNQIRAERGRIQSDIDSILKDYSEELDSTISNLFGGDREAAADVLTSADMKAKAKELGFEIGDATVQYLQDFKNRIIELPTEYFETKFERPVMLNEFEAAVVPNDVDSEIREALESEDLDVREYDPELAGDRERVTMEAAQDSGKVLFSTSPTFYSNAERAVENIKQNKATAEQWKAMLTKAGGIKVGEDKWMGLSTWLDENKGKSLTKDEVLQFVRDNGIQMEEVNYGDIYETPGYVKLNDEYMVLWNDAERIFQEANKQFADYVGEMEAKYGDDYYRQMTPQERQIYNRLSIDQELRDPNIYSNEDIAFREMVDRYGDNFEMAFRATSAGLEIDDRDAASYFVGDVQAIDFTRLDYTTEGLDNKREIAFKVPNIEPYQEHDEVHFGPENQGKAVMWVRFGETTDADGNRVLVIDEIQSNRHQEGREKGYKVDEKTAFAEYKKAIADYRAAAKRNDTEAMKEAEKRYNLYGAIAGQLPGGRESIPASVRDAVPSAPFEKNWHEVAMKRMLRLAAEEGFDKVAWTTGEQQTERYNLGGVVSSIKASDWGDNIGIEDTKVVTVDYKGEGGEDLIVDRNGNIVADVDDRYINKTLADVVGKEMAVKLLADGEVSISGNGLRIGGEGMKGFYDNILPRFMDKYGKRWGVKTGTVELPNVEEAGRTMHSVDVTPEMKESVMQGQPLFSVSDVNEAMPRNTEQEPEVDGGLRFSVREKPEPKKTIPVYKLMRLGDDGKLYPLFIDGTEPIELGVWYDADSPNMDMLVDLPIGVHLIDTDNSTSMTMEEYVKQNNIKLKKGQKYPPKEVIESTPNGQRWVYIEPTERGQRRFGGESRRYWNLGINGSGSVSTFSMRPGWHAGSLPTMRQIGKGAKKNLRDDRFVWVEGLISADIDYNEEAQGNPDNDIPTHIPTDGFYMKATNANAKASQADRVGWYISGAFMPVKIMSDSEARQVIDEWNADPKHADLQVEYDFPRESGKVFNAETMQLEDEAETRFSTSAAVAALKDDERVYNDLLGKVFSGVSNETRRGIVEDAMRNRGNDFGAATEAWLGGLADDGKFADVDRREWGRVKLALHQALMDNGVDVSEPLTDGESRYVLWKAGQIDDGVFSMAEDIVMQDRLLPGESGVRFSTSKVEQMTPIEKRYPDMEDFKDNTSILFHYKWATRHLDENFLRLVELDLDDISKDINSQKKFIKERPWAASEASKRKLEGLIKLRDNITKELEQKGKAQGNNAWGIKRGTSFTFDQFDKLFKAHNSDPINAELWDKVLATSRALGIDNIKVVGNLGSTTSGASFGGRVRISEQYLNSYARSDNRKAETMLHEMIHHVTSYAFNAVKEKKDVPPHIADAVRTLNDVFNAIKSDPDFNGQYGKSDVYELVAELSNPEFREKLKEKNLWQKIVDGLMRLLGYEPREGVDKTTAYAEARAALEKLLESPDTDLYKEYAEDLAKYRPRFKMESEQESDLRFSVTPRDRAIARDQYERWMKSGRMQWLESMQDSMLGLKKLMQAIMGERYRYIEDIPTFENPYIAENLMSSATQAQQQAFYTEFMKPLLKEVGKLCKGGKKAREKAREDLTNYLMAKHGLERNQVLADRDAQETAQAGGNYQDAYAENRERDYSGLTALTGEDDVHAAEAKAQQIVDDYEAQHDTTELWNKINAATQVTLEKQYKSGMLSYAEYQRISDMFEYYVPLRGWEETTSDQVYGYLTSKAGPFLGGGIVKRAEGRTSKADDPIATIAQMGDDSIRTGNRNLMKQTFLNFVQNHPSDAVSVSDLWLKYDDVTDEWVPVFADIDPNDSPKVVEQKLQAFEQQMQQLASQEPTKYKHGREAANIPYRVIPGMEKEHQVLVKRNGQTWVLTINGNPRAAQALNGLTNPDVPMEGAWASMIKGAEWVNRTLSALYTTLSPAFIVSNFLRDSGYSNTMVWVRESPNYALRFNKNYLKLNPGTLRWLLGKWEEGTLDESKPLQKHFKEFMLNGGETGFAMVQNLEKYKKNMLNEVKNMNSKNFARKSMKVLGSQYELLGRSIENCARFAAYVTSREMGRSAERAAYDAKEISVNFNKKGSGGKSLGKVGQTMSGNVGAFISGMARSLYTFWNAGVQGMTNAGRAVKRHPVKAALLGAGPLYAAGFLAPVLAQLMGAGGDGDDDKNAYYNLPEYVRRSNLCIWLGDSWLTIPLPIEFRSIYGMGELTYGVISGNERYSDEELAMQVAGQFSQLLPIDMLEGGGGFHPFIPTLFKPFVEAEKNKSWSGLPIYRDSEWNKDEPEYTKAFSNANEWIVSGAEWLNAKTGGDEFKKGWIDINPAKIEYMLKGYLGGIYTTIDEVRRAAETALGKRDFEWRNIPLANRVIKQGDERTESKKLRDEYFKYKEDYEETKRLINKYKNAEDTDLFDYAKKLELMNYSKEYGRYLIFEKYATMLDAYQKAKKGASGEVLKKIEEDEKRLMRQLVDEMHAFEDGKTTVNDRPKLSKKDRSEDYGYMYNKLRTYIDINEDALLDSALKRAKAADDKGMVAALNSIKRSIGEMKKGLGHGKDEEVMNSIREMRGSVLSSFGIIGGDEELPEPEEQWQEEPQEEFQEEEPEMIEEEPLEEPEDDEFDESLSYE